jgi:hypothetical protein
MLRALLTSLIVLLAFPVTARPAMLTRADVRLKLDRFVTEARAHQTVRDWISAAHLFSKLDRDALLTAPRLPEKMPTITRRFNDRELVISVDGLTADFQNIHQGELMLNGEKIYFQSRVDLATAYQLIDRHLRRKQTSLWPRWLSPAPAEAEAIHPTCISSKYEFMFRSPANLLESNFGYAGRLFAASLVVSTLNIATGVFAHCGSQIEEMRKILREGNIGIKSIDCGSDATGSDRSIEFWVPEPDEKGHYKTRSFNLDYTLLVAQDAYKEDEDEEVAKNKEPALYVFGTTDLQEVRARKVNAEKNEYYCDSAFPGSEKFAKYKKEIEPYRKIFQYIGDFNSCYSCYHQMLRKLRTPKAPGYFPKLEKKAEAEDAAEDEEEAPRTHPAH